MGSLKVGGATFKVFPQDHEPRHVHVHVAEAKVIVDLRADGTVSLASRKDAIRPGNAKRSDVRKALTLAARHFEQLVALWEEMHAE